MAIADDNCRALLINGGGGAGKSTIAATIGRLLTKDNHPTGVVDLDALSQFGPAPAGGPGFHDRLRLRNLAAVWTTYRAVGARFMVVSGIMETAALCSAYADCLAGCDVQMVRLETPRDLVEERTRGTVRGPNWDLQEALAQSARLPRLEDFSVANDRPPDDVATEVLVVAGWIPAARTEG
jgi:chloramphenicol 3-O-phosphotransferase